MSNRRGMPLLKDIKKPLSKEEALVVSRQKREAEELAKKEAKKGNQTKKKWYTECMNCGYHFLGKKCSKCG